MRLIAERQLLDAKNKTYVQGELISQPIKPLPMPSEAFTCHVYCSEYNLGAVALMKEVAEERELEMRMFDHANPYSRARRSKMNATNQGIEEEAPQASASSNSSPRKRRFGLSNVPVRDLLIVTDDFGMPREAWPSSGALSLRWRGPRGRR